MTDDVEQLSLDKAASHLLEECRMVLPGIQALFGFQLIAVLNERFQRDLSPSEQRLHLGAILCIVVAIALVMAPAALHRRREPRSVSRRFLAVSSQLLMWGMAPLALGTTLDVYLVSRLILHTSRFAIVPTALAVIVFIAMWVVMPARVDLGHRDRG